MKQVSVNFGAIKDTVYTFSGKQLVNESQKNGQITVLNAFLNEMKENPILRIQYLIYKNIEEGFCKRETLAERYINQNLKLIENFNWENILHTNKSIRSKLLETTHVESIKGKEELYEAIHMLIKSVTQKGFREIDKSQDAYDLVMEHLMKEKKVPVQENTVEEEYPKLLSWKFVTKLAVNQFNERFNHLNESERDLVKLLLSPEPNKKNYFIDLKNESLEQIKNLIAENEDPATLEAINKFKTKIESLDENTLNGQDMDEAIINLFELKDSLELPADTK